MNRFVPWPGRRSSGCALAIDAWPRGIYARAWIRGYATVIGLDPIDTVDEFCKLFPQGDRRAQGTFRDFAAIVAHNSEYRDEFEGEYDRRRSSAPANITHRRSWRQQMARLMRTFLSLRPARSSRPVRSVQHPN